jgi:hypothetical protein
MPKRGDAQATADAFYVLYVTIRDDIPLDRQSNLLRDSSRR